VSTGRYFVATDLDALRRESELVTLENTFLKTRIATLEEELAATRESVDQAREELVRLRAARADAAGSAE
jgi:hypothetical protein